MIDKAGHVEWAAPPLSLRRRKYSKINFLTCELRIQAYQATEEPNSFCAVEQFPYLEVERS
jgi:hypothetical protein